MTCEGCTPLIGDMARVTTGPIVVTGTGFAITEVGRIYVPPSADILKLRAELNLAAGTVGQTAHAVAVFVPATAANLLGSVGGKGAVDLKDTTVWANGQGVEVTAMPASGPWPPGDYILGVNRGANPVSVIATALQPALIWWER